MNPLRSVGARLSLALAIVVAAALGLVDLIVVPSLEQNLVHTKLAQLRKALPGIERQVQEAGGANLDLALSNAAAGANARVSLFTELDPETLIAYADSNPVSSADLTEDPIALRAVRAADPPARAAAERIAAGDFDEPVVDGGRDELGQLARAFERMRERLAQLDHARASSSPTRRTSCARRSSRSAASSSCSRTRSSTSRRGASSSRRCASRSSG
jgi:methyl-accepting chemotaxis protein